MKVCPRCGFKDPDIWRHSRFDWNADYCRFDEFQTEYPELAKLLEDKKNFEPVRDGDYIYYRRGTEGLYVYRVWKHEFRIPRERRLHRVCTSTNSQKLLPLFL